MNKNASLANRLNRMMTILAGVALLGGLIGCVVSTLTFGAAQKVISQSADREIGLHNLTVAVKDAQVNVIQVQQWLTDISATRGLDGLNDGFDLAEKHANAFKAELVKAQQAAERLDAPTFLASLAQVERAFPAYYETGKRMAKAYVEEGPKGGNALMGVFDKASADIYDSLDEMTSKLDELAVSIAEEQEASLISIQNARVTVISVTLFGLIAVAIAAWLVRRSVQRRVSVPMQDAVFALRELSRGNVEITIQGIEREDEIGQMARAFAVFQKSDAERRELMARQQESEEKLLQRQNKLSHLFEMFDGEFKRILNDVQSAGRVVEGTTRHVRESASASRHRATTAIQTGERTSANIQTVAAAVEEMSAAIGDISARAAEGAAETKASVQRSRETLTTVHELQSAVEAIGGIVSLITDIAEQTNLLALNATIEAARAGDAGRGFAVVAGEVKALATQTANATSRISDQIGAIRNVGERSAEAIHAIAASIEKLDLSNASIASAIEQQSGVVQEVSQASAEIARATEELNLVISKTGDDAVETERQSNESQGAVSNMLSRVNDIGSNVSKFMAEIRAA